MPLAGVSEPILLMERVCEGSRGRRWKGRKEDGKEKGL